MFHVELTRDCCSVNPRIIQFVERLDRTADPVQKSRLRSGFWKGHLLMPTTPVATSSRPSKGMDVTFALANVVGIVIYLVLASRGWRIPQEHGAVPVTGEPFVWILAMPVFGIFFLANITWGVLLVQHREPKRGLWWFFIAMPWVIALWVDFAHH